MDKELLQHTHPASGIAFLAIIVVSCMLVVSLVLLAWTRRFMREQREDREVDDARKFKKYLDKLDSREIGIILSSTRWPKIFFVFIAIFSAQQGFAQSAQNRPLSQEPGIVIAITLVLIPILAGIVLMAVKLSNIAKQRRIRHNAEEAEKFAAYLQSLPEGEKEILLQRKAALDYHLTGTELSGEATAGADDKGVLTNINALSLLPFVGIKKKAAKRPDIEPALSRIILWYIGSATFWLLFGTTIGEYMGIKFVAPDADHLSWLSFGRIRPVHTNAVFWGWASLAMMGLGYYIVPMVSNAALASIKRAWYALWSVNLAVILGSICLMAGINNGGGEYREYIWPVMLLFAIGVALTLTNFLQTIGRRKTKEIYISNWYIVGATIFALVIVVTAYLPFWQDGLGETIIQGYYMHQGVGMWFMLFTLGIVYYFLPQQLNKPIYSYSLGILAFWTQILFYTLIGTHHFIFSSIPWWLQTVAIVGSIGMIIPVAAGTTNFIMTFNGAWYKIPGSYTLPFFLTGIVFYFTGSMQGTAEAFRSTNLIWHFTDFTVAHSHLTMYGIICFFVWGAIYAVIPRLTGKEAPQTTIGAHFWLALIGLLFYTFPLMYGATLKGVMWTEGKPFLDGVMLMAPYWLWRAIGGSLMWFSHLFFAYNVYKMIVGNAVIDVKQAALEKISRSAVVSTEPLNKL
ncbi:MAG TPA: cbb3-type cytochrome c oxidase subunit I [Puia sp.]|jgi:cytochrome c oxidase cbb3-type subunit 1|nr:cbb3-type cytochrome c oxidase subunit I [Puia sp.]